MRPAVRRAPRPNPGSSAAGTPFGARLGLARSAPRSAPTVAGPQCAGTAIAMGAPPPTVRAIASRASTSTLSPRAGSRRRRPAEPDRRPARRNRSARVRAAFRFGFSPGTPTSAARSLNSVRTERRMTGARPIRAATRLVIPIDNPSESLMFPSLAGPRIWPMLTIAAQDVGNREIPLMAARTPNGQSPNAGAAELGFGTDHRRRRPSIASDQAFGLSPHIYLQGEGGCSDGKLATRLCDVVGAVTPTPPQPTPLIRGRRSPTPI